MTDFQGLHLKQHIYIYTYLKEREKFYVVVSFFLLLVLNEFNFNLAETIQTETYIHVHELCACLFFVSANHVFFRQCLFVSIYVYKRRRYCHILVLVIHIFRNLNNTHIWVLILYLQRIQWSLKRRSY